MDDISRLIFDVLKMICFCLEADGAQLESYMLGPASAAPQGWAYMNSTGEWVVWYPDEKKLINPFVRNNYRKPKINYIKF